MEAATVNRESRPVKIKCQVWRRRNLMERYLIVIFFLMFLLSIVMIGLLLHLVYTYKRPIIPVCYSSLCRREAGRIISFMDFSVDPCEDFYNFSCGSHLKNHEYTIIEKPVDLRQLIQENMRRLSKQLIETADENVEPEFIKKVKKFYQSCMNAPTYTDTSENIKYLLSKAKLKFWFNVKEEEHNMDNVLAIMQIYGRTNPFYYIGNGENVTAGELYIDAYGGILVELKILLNTTDEECIRKKEEYRNLLLYTFYKANELVDAEEADKLIEFETTVAKLKQNYSDYDYEVKSIHSSLKEYLPECEGLSVSGVIKYIFEYLDHADDFSDEIPITVYNSRYLEDMCKILKVTEQRTLYNYLIWYFLAVKLREFDPYFKRKFSDLEDNDYIPIARWTKCTEHMFLSNLNPGITYLILKNLQPDESLDEVKDYVLDIRKAMEDMISAESWIDPASKTFSINRIWNISADIGYSAESLDVRLLENHFSMINVTDDYLENRSEEKKWWKRWWLFNDTLSITNSLNIPRPTGSSAYFTGSRFVLRLGLLVPPYFIPKGSKFFNYALTGFIIAHEIAHDFDSIDTDENDTYIWTNETIQAFKERKQCYVNQYSKYPFDEETNLMVNGSFTIRDNIADNSGVFQSYAAYENYLKAYGEEPRLPALDYTNQQMFFISYAQQWCKAGKPEIEYYKYDNHSPRRYRVIGPLQNFPQFSDAFKCPLGSPMNPPLKCKMYG